MKFNMRMLMLISLACWIAFNSADGRFTVRDCSCCLTVLCMCWGGACPSGRVDWSEKCNGRIETTAAAEDCSYPKVCLSSEPLKPVVLCGTSQITVLLRRCVLKALGHTGADLQLSDPACAPSAACYAGEPYVRFVVPHNNSCGSTLSETNTSIVFENAVWSVEDAGESWRAKPIHLEFSCSYSTGASLSLGLPSNTVTSGSVPQVHSGTLPTTQNVPSTTTKSAGQLPSPGQNTTLASGQNAQSVFQQIIKLTSGQKTTASSGKNPQTTAGSTQSQFGGVVSNPVIKLAAFIEGLFGVMSNMCWKLGSFL